MDDECILLGRIICHSMFLDRFLKYKNVGYCLIVVLNLTIIRDYRLLVGLSGPRIGCQLDGFFCFHNIIDQLRITEYVYC